MADKKICPLMSNQFEIEDVVCLEDKCGCWNEYWQRCGLMSADSVKMRKG